ncbi:MAG: restriction endonuclease, partial [Chloroflexi bacterium]
QEFITNAFNLLQHLRPGKWLYEVGKLAISSFYQYEHLAHIEQKVNEDPILGAALGGNYIIRPDIVISRRPVSDDEINHHQTILESDTPIVRGTPLRAANHPDPDHPLPLLHASISCKWTIRSDRSQNTRTEALNLVRNRKGHTPHIVAVTAEPLPTRIASLALGTGDLDCVYHFALPELQKAIEEADNEDQLDMLKTLVDGRRLRDISDLPFDLAI